VFELTPDQQAYLRNNGVDQYVIDQIPQINRDVRDNLLPAPASPPTGAPVYQNPYPPNYYQPPPPQSQPVQPAPVQPVAPNNPSLNTPVPPPPG
jgi:hypothetical protein